MPTRTRRPHITVPVPPPAPVHVRNVLDVLPRKLRALAEDLAGKDSGGRVRVERIQIVRGGSGFTMVDPPRIPDEE